MYRARQIALLALTLALLAIIAVEGPRKPVAAMAAVELHAAGR